MKRLNRIKILKFAAIFLVSIIFLSSCKNKDIVDNKDNLNISNVNKLEIDEEQVKYDFYEAVNGKWLQDAIIPSDKVSVGGFNDIDEEITNILIKDFDDMVNGKKEINNSLLEEFINYYKITLDFEKRDQEGEKPLLPYLEKVEALNNMEELNSQMKNFINMGIKLPFQFGVMADMKNAEYYTMYAYAPTLFLPDKTYYTQDSSDQLLDIYAKMQQGLLILAGKTEEEAHKIVKEALAFDKLLVPYTKTRQEYNDFTAMYNPKSIDEFSSYSKNTNFKNLLLELTGKNVEKVIVGDLQYYEKINEILNEENFELLKSWMIVNLVYDYSSYLSEDFRQQNAVYSMAITGQEKLSEKERSAFNLATMSFSHVIGDYYGRTYFGEEAKNDVIKMVENIIDVFEKRLKDNNWLSDDTKLAAIKKLNLMEIQIGYPDKINSLFKDLKVDMNKSLLENTVDITYDLSEKQYKLYGERVDRSDWSMSAHTVNAMYSPMENTITFPAAILKAPFYSMEQTPSQNYGGIGTVIAHEITHAFDNNGAQFDEYGNIKNWWTEDDYKEFEKRSAQMIDLFNEIEHAGIPLNGEMTVGENIADAGGLSCALEVVKNMDNGNLKEFFANWATIWRAKFNPEYEQLLMNVDVHAPNKLRTNIQLKNIDEFYDTFNVEESDGMYLDPEKRVKIW